MQTNHRDIYNPNHFKQIISKLKHQEKLFKKISNKDVVRRISKQRVMVRSELNDLDIIWRRFLRTRAQLLRLDAVFHSDGKTMALKTPADKRLFRRINNLSATLKVDLKSLFLFADILFNKLVLLVPCVHGPTAAVKYQSFTAFLKTARNLNDRTSPEALLYRALGEDLERIDVLLGFYRDKFIVHVLGAYQEGVSRSIGPPPEFKLNHTSYKLDQFNFVAFHELITQLRGILPDTDRYGHPLTSHRDPRLPIDTLFRNLHKIKDPELRQKAEGCIRSVGINSPDIYYLIKTVKDTTLKLIDFLTDEITKTHITSGPPT